MKLTASVKLTPTEEQAEALLDTIERANDACDYISEIAWDKKTFRRYKLHKLSYYPTREQSNLSANIVNLCIAKVAAAYKLGQKKQRRFKKRASIGYDKKILRYYPDEVSIWTTSGRQRIPFVAGEHQKELLKSRKGESRLLYRDGNFYLHAVCDVEEPPTIEPDEFLGVDLGITNIAADNDGTIYSGKQLNALRHRHARLRTKLQAKGTKSAKRLLKKRSRRERRFAANVNHCISKTIVASAEGTGRGIALEDLTGARERTTVRKAQRRRHSSWAFFQLRQFIEYKARLSGIPVIIVDRYNTSKMCPECGHIDKRNRRSGRYRHQFLCTSCGFADHADVVAAVNISRAAVGQPNAARVEAEGSIQSN